LLAIGGVLRRVRIVRSGFYYWTAITSIEREVRKVTEIEKTLLIVRDTVADRFIDNRRRTFEGSDRIQLGDRDWILNPG